MVEEGAGGAGAVTAATATEEASGDEVVVVGARTATQGSIRCCWKSLVLLRRVASDSGERAPALLLLPAPAVPGRKQNGAAALLFAAAGAATAAAGGRAGAGAGAGAGAAGARGARAPPAEQSAVSMKPEDVRGPAAPVPAPAAALPPREAASAPPASFRGRRRCCRGS